MKTPDFRHMSPEAFELYRPVTEDEFDAYRNESELRKWCKEFNEDYLDDGARERYKEYQEEYGNDNFDKQELARRMDDLSKD